MTNSILLNYKIKVSGYRLGFLAEKLGLSRAGLYNKINNKTEFLASEIQALSDLLNLDAKDREDIFFDEKVDDLATIKKLSC